MKKTLLAVALMCGLTASTVWASVTKYEVTVKGMVCSFCAQGITKKMKARPEVEAVNVLLGEQKVYLTIKDGQSLSEEAIRKILKEAGYGVEKIEKAAS